MVRFWKHPALQLDLTGLCFLAGLHRADRQSSIDTVRFAKWYLMLKEMKRIIAPIKRGHFMNVDSKELIDAAQFEEARRNRALSMPP
jgi:hypothetical protein